MDLYKKKIRRFYISKRRMPSYGELTTLLGFKSKNAAYQLAEKLIEDGFITKDKTGKLLPHNLYGSIRVLGTVEAGFPSPAEEELSDTITIDEWLIENHEATYLLEVKGDSMKDAGIKEGDFVVAERTDKHKVGDIVVAQIDGEWTMKYLRKDKKGYYLEAANKRYKDIRPNEELEITAVVRGVIRKY